MPLAVVTFAFDPFLHLGDQVVRWETLGVAAAVLLVLVTAVLLARRTPPDDAGRPLRTDDALYLALGAIPGAVVGGRVGYVLLHLDYYLGQPGAIVDPSAGSFQLSLGVLGGVVTALYVVRLLDAPAARWLHVAAVPVLIGIGAGKAAMAFGGTGQGDPSAAAWATAYLGPGPWGSLAPALPSVPSQLLEAAGTLLAAVGVVLILMAGGFGRRDGRAFLVAMAAWLVVRIAVATTWRDPAVVGPLVADQLISLVLLAGIVVLLVALRRRDRSTVAEATTAEAATG